MECYSLPKIKSGNSGSWIFKLTKQSKHRRFIPCYSLKINKTQLSQSKSWQYLYCLTDFPYWAMGLQANQKMNSVILKNLYRPDNRSKCTKPNTTSINQCFQFRVNVLMIWQCNFGNFVKSFLQNGITLLSCDLELHLLKLFLYSNDRKHWNNSQYTQIRKEHLTVSFLFLTRKDLLTGSLCIEIIERISIQHSNCCYLVIYCKKKSGSSRGRRSGFKCFKIPFQ
jgi:hypothetical protein